MEPQASSISTKRARFALEEKFLHWSVAFLMKSECAVRMLVFFLKPNWSSRIVSAFLRAYQCRDSLRQVQRNFVTYDRQVMGRVWAGVGMPYILFRNMTRADRILYLTYGQTLSQNSFFPVRQRYIAIVLHTWHLSSRVLVSLQHQNVSALNPSSPAPDLKNLFVQTSTARSAIWDWVMFERVGKEFGESDSGLVLSGVECFYTQYSSRWSDIFCPIHFSSPIWMASTMESFLLLVRVEIISKTFFEFEEKRCAARSWMTESSWCARSSRVSASVSGYLSARKDLFFSLARSSLCFVLHTFLGQGRMSPMHYIKFVVLSYAASVRANLKCIAQCLVRVTAPPRKSYPSSSPQQIGLWSDSDHSHLSFSVSYSSRRVRAIEECMWSSSWYVFWAGCLKVIYFGVQKPPLILVTFYAGMLKSPHQTQIWSFFNFLRRALAWSWRRS